MIKKIAIISFTGKGAETAVRLLEGLEKKYRCQAYIKEKFWSRIKKEGENGLPENVENWRETGELWTKKRFEDSDAIIYIGAAGIAVRLIAPWLKDKMEDPAVVVLDESGCFSIALLSGHVGGANDLARETAEILGGTAVITTATDRNCKFAVDVFARNHHMAIGDRRLAKEISARILEGETITLQSDFPIEGELPKELALVSGGKARPDIYITIKEKKEWEKETLMLIPRWVSLGMGCRKGADKEAVWKWAEKVCREEGIDMRSIGKLATIDLKKDEPGLLEAAKRLKADFLAFSPEELSRLEGEFSESEFVRRTTGVGNVCERAAVMAAAAPAASSRDEAAGGARLIVKKTCGEGVTAAAALEEKTIVIRREEWQES